MRERRFIFGSLRLESTQGLELKGVPEPEHLGVRFLPGPKLQKHAAALRRRQRIENPQFGCMAKLIEDLVFKRLVHALDVDSDADATADRGHHDVIDMRDAELEAFIVVFDKRFAEIVA
jgi:hypothetical protein